LRLVHCSDAIDRFHFDDDIVADDEIHAIRTIQSHASVHEGKRLLLVERQATIGHFVRKTGRVSGFEQTWAERLVNRDCGSKYPFAGGVQSVLHAEL
jgi:hypothetical protein